MKKKYLFCTKAWLYLCEIPLAVLLALAFYYNPSIETNFKLIPLIIVLICTMIFFFVYFFRIIVISFEEVRSRGPFSSRDSAVINKDKTLILTMLSYSNLKVELYGNDGLPPMIEGLKGEPSIDIYLFRGRAIGGKRRVSSILRYFGVSESDIKDALSQDTFTGEYEFVSLTAEKREDIRELRLKFKETV